MRIRNPPTFIMSTSLIMSLIMTLLVFQCTLVAELELSKAKGTEIELPDDEVDGGVKTYNLRIFFNCWYCSTGWQQMSSARTREPSPLAARGVVGRSVRHGVGQKPTKIKTSPRPPSFTWRQGARRRRRRWRWKRAEAAAAGATAAGARADEGGRGRQGRG